MLETGAPSLGLFGRFSIRLPSRGCTACRRARTLQTHSEALYRSRRCQKAPHEIEGLNCRSWTEDENERAGERGERRFSKVRCPVQVPMLRTTLADSGGVHIQYTSCFTDTGQLLIGSVLPPHQVHGHAFFMQSRLRM